jgi:hypothetical protein
MHRVEIRAVRLNVLHGHLPRAETVIRLCELLEDSVASGQLPDVDGVEDDEDDDFEALKVERDELRQELLALRQTVMEAGYKLPDSKILTQLEEEDEQNGDRADGNSSTRASLGA